MHRPLLEHREKCWASFRPLAPNWVAKKFQLTVGPMCWSTWGGLGKLIELPDLPDEVVPFPLDSPQLLLLLHERLKVIGLELCQAVDVQLLSRSGRASEGSTSASS